MDIELKVLLNNSFRMLLVSYVSIRPAVSNLVAIRHMWRMAVLMWQQAQFLKFNIFGNIKDCDLHVQ
jgi:hypothetical protein